MKQIALAAAIAGGLLGAWASSSDTVATTSVSPIQSSSLTCAQICEESARIVTRAQLASAV